jgi:hypothetical protein
MEGYDLGADGPRACAGVIPRWRPAVLRRCTRLGSRSSLGSEQRHPSRDAVIEAAGPSPYFVRFQHSNLWDSAPDWGPEGS